MSEIKEYLVLPSYRVSLLVDSGVDPGLITGFEVKSINSEYEVFTDTVSVTQDFNYNHTTGLWTLPSCIGLRPQEIRNITVKPLTVNNSGVVSPAMDIVALSEHVRESGVRQALFDFLLTKNIDHKDIPVRLHGDAWGRPRTLTGVNAVEGAAVSIGCAYMSSEDYLSHREVTTELVVPFRVMVKGMNEDDGDIATNIAGRIRRILKGCELINYGIVNWRWTGRAPRVNHDVKSITLDFEMRTQYEEDENHLCP